jgi:2-phospho-L-lactate guanylyltransferase
VPVPIHHVVLVPVKDPGVGKSRLNALGEPVRRRLARAFALDTVSAALAADGVVGVVVATDDPGTAAAGRAVGCLVVPDAGGLNPALVAAAAAAAAQWPGSMPVALCGDLPALTPHGLGQALRALPATGAGFVADAQGTGTTLYAAPYDSFAPAFGPGSAAAHRSAGALELIGAQEELRLDVDDPNDLDRARLLGVGPHTSRVLAWSAGGTSPRDRS